MLKFDHTQDNLYLSLGLSDERKDYCNDNLIFTAITKPLMVKQLYDDMDDAPKELTTVSSDIEVILSRLTEESERVYSLLTYHKVTDSIRPFVSVYIETDGNVDKSFDIMKEHNVRFIDDIDDASTIKMIDMSENKDGMPSEIADMLRETLGQLKKKMVTMKLKSKIASSFKLIETVKNCNGNFDKFREFTVARILENATKNKSDEDSYSLKDDDDDE